MPPHEELNQECVRMFTELNKNTATLQTMMTNHLEHDIEERKALKETLDAFNSRIEKLTDKWWLVLLILVGGSGGVSAIIDYLVK